MNEGAISIITGQPPENNGPSLPRPTQAAFKPASGRQTWGGIGLGALCVGGIFLGMAAWRYPELVNVQSTNQTVLLMTFLLPFIFPVFLPMALYLWWDTWRQWRRTRTFEKSKQVSTAVITHLWVDPPRPPGKHYYVGYRFGSGHTAYQEVQARPYKTLAVGDEVPVEYAGENPALSRPDLQRRPKKKKSTRPAS
jgi:hypothetical protein